MAKKEMPKRAEVPVKRTALKPKIEALTFNPANYLIFGAAILVIIIGFFLLAMGSMTLAPFLLVVGFSILVPVAIMVGLGKGKVSDERVKESGSKAE